MATVFGEADRPRLVNPKPAGTNLDSFVRVAGNVLRNSRRPPAIPPGLAWPLSISCTNARAVESNSERSQIDGTCNAKQTLTMMTPLLRSFAFGCLHPNFVSGERNRFSPPNQFKLAKLANFLSAHPAGEVARNEPVRAQRLWVL